MGDAWQDQENNNSSSSLETSQERKSCYRELLNLVEQIQESEGMGLEAAKEIGAIMKRANSFESEHNISQRYQHPDETLLDSMVLSCSISILVKCVEALNVDEATYDPAAFAIAIMRHCSNNGDEFNDRDLLKLMPFVHDIIPENVCYSTLYGAYDLENLPQPKQRKERQKREREQFQKKEPEKVTSLDSEETGIEEIVNVLHEVLTECYKQNNEQPISYYKYVVDTSSFAETVENMFYCSFLVKDGRAKLDLDGSGVPFISPVKKHELKKYRNVGGVNSQIISSLSLPIWETFKKEGYIQKYKETLHQ